MRNNDGPKEDTPNVTLFELSPSGSFETVEHVTEPFHEESSSSSSQPASHFEQFENGEPENSPEENFHFGLQVDYEDLTTIDWSYEYQKARFRKRMLLKDTTLAGKWRLMFESSQPWIVLLTAGISVGFIYSFIVIAENWLADLKMGYCTTHIYLNQKFCCPDYDDIAQCEHWKPWSRVFGASHPIYIIQWFFYCLSGILFATTSGYLVKSLAPFAQNSGIAQIKTVLGGFVIRGFLGPMTLLIKGIGLCLSVGSSLWVGREGPLVHIACCCLDLFSLPFESIRSNEARKRQLYSAAAAAGISVAFGSPIGGVLFSLEQVSFYFPDATLWQSFVCAMVAAVSLQLVNPHRTDRLVLFHVDYTVKTWRGFEVIPFILIGAFGGLFGILFIRLNLKIASWRRDSRISHYPVVEVAILAAVTTIINYPNIFMRYDRSVLVADLFRECGSSDYTNLLCAPDRHGSAVLLLLVTSGLGALLSAYSFGTIVPAGIILPSITVGACLGRAVGIIVQMIRNTFPGASLFSACGSESECVVPAVYALVGGAAALAGVTRMTISVVVIIFELTGALPYVLPIMIGTMVAKWTADMKGREGIYEQWIRFLGYPYLDVKKVVFPDVKAADFMTGLDRLVVIKARGQNIRSLQAILHDYDYKGFPVVHETLDRSGDETQGRKLRVIGYIARRELDYALKQVLENGTHDVDSSCYFVDSDDDGNFYNSPTSLDLRPYFNSTPISLSDKTSLHLVATVFRELGLPVVLIISYGELRGLITKKDLLRELNSSYLFSPLLQ